METQIEARKFFGCRVTQRLAPGTVKFFAFYAPVSDILKWSGVKEVEKDPHGTQRTLRLSRSSGVTRFLRKGSINTIPNNILLAFNENSTNFKPLDSELNQCLQDTINNIDNGCKNVIEWGILEFEFDPNKQKEEPKALVVDGQHRLFGMADFKDEDLPVLVVSLLEAPLIEQAFQFVVINNKAVRVEAENVKAIFANMAQLDEEGLNKRLLASGVKYGKITSLLTIINELETSPFRNLLDWPNNREGTRLVDLTAIEQSVSYIRTLFKRYLEEDYDSLIEIFNAIWRGVKSAFPNIWGKEKISGENNQFMTKVNIVALNEYIGENLKVLWGQRILMDIFDIKEIEERVFSMLSPITELYWETKWNTKPQDNTNMRRLIKEDLNTLIENNRFENPWYEELNLVTKV